MNQQFLRGCFPHSCCRSLADSILREWHLKFQRPADGFADLFHNGGFKFSPAIRQLVLFRRADGLHVGEGLKFEPRDARHLNFVAASAKLRSEWNNDGQGARRVVVLALHDAHRTHFAVKSQIHIENFTNFWRHQVRSRFCSVFERPARCRLWRCST